MKQNKFISRISMIFGVTQAEFYVALVLVVGLAFGIVGRHIFPLNNEQTASSVVIADSLNYILDSLAETNKQTFVGTNLANEPIEKLAELDTISNKKKTKKIDFTGVVNINTASKSQLMQLYKIGEKTADKIIEYRTKTPFRRKEDILNVKGIGVKTYESIAKNITV